MPGPNSEARSPDTLGIEDLGDSVRAATEKFLDGDAALVSRVWLPAAEEFGLALRDRVSARRARTAAKIPHSSAKSPSEGLGEALTLHRLDLSADLGASSKTTNVLESIMARAEQRTAKVDHSPTSEQKQRQG